jgi:hypothetical protein
VRPPRANLAGGREGKTGAHFRQCDEPWSQIRQGRDLIQFVVLRPPRERGTDTQTGNWLRGLGAVQAARTRVAGVYHMVPQGVRRLECLQILERSTDTQTENRLRGLRAAQAVRSLCLYHMAPQGVRSLGERGRGYLSPPARSVQHCVFGRPAGDFKPNLFCAFTHTHDTQEPRRPWSHRLSVLLLSFGPVFN